MFLFERLFGISTYMLVLIFVCLLLVKTNVSCKSVFRFYLLCLCIMAFFYKPYVTGDLYRIFEQMDYFASMDFNLFWKNFALESSTPVARLLFWIFGKIGVHSLLPAFSAFFCYSLIFYIIQKTKQLYDISNRTVAIVTFFIMTTSMYISVIGGIRMMVALSMVTFSFFRANVEKKIRLADILFFISSILIHAMSFVVIGVIALSLLSDSQTKASQKAGYVLAIGIIGAVFIFKFSDTIRGVYQKFLDYVWGDKYSDPWEYVMGAIIIIAILLVFSEFHHVRRTGDYSKISKCNSAAIYCVVLALCFFFEFSIFYRFGGHLAVLFSIPSMMVSLEKTKGRSSSLIKGIDLRTLVILLSCIIAAVSCTRGSLCSLKFFEL